MPTVLIGEGSLIKSQPDGLSIADRRAPPVLIESKRPPAHGFPHVLQYCRLLLGLPGSPCLALAASERDGDRRPLCQRQLGHISPHSLHIAKMAQ